MKKSKLIFASNNLKKEQDFFLFFIILVGVLIPTISGGNDYNFWVRLDFILKNTYFQFLLFIAISLNTFWTTSEYLKNKEIIIRFKNYKKIIEVLCQKLIISTFYLLLTGFVLAISGAWVFSLGDRQMIIIENYQINLSTYIIFFMIRMIIIVIFMNLIVLLISLKFKKLGFLGCAFVNALLLFLPTPSDTFISRFYELIILPHAYFMNISYSSFGLEVICSFIEILFLILTYKLLFFLFTKKAKGVDL